MADLRQKTVITVVGRTIVLCGLPGSGRRQKPIVRHTAKKSNNSIGARPYRYVRIGMFQDLRFGLKLLWKEKAFTLTALATLALCIGANTAIFTVLNTVILEPLPFAEPERLVSMYNIYPDVGVTDRGANGIPDYLDRKQISDAFESVALFGE